MVPSRVKRRNQKFGRTQPSLFNHSCIVYANTQNTMINYNGFEDNEIFHF